MMFRFDSLNAILSLLMLALHAWSVPAHAQSPLTGRAAEVYSRAQAGRWYADAARLNPTIVPTSDGPSFLGVWKPAGTEPARWIVTLHGSRGFATDDLGIWSRSLQGRASSYDVGVIALQWWFGPDDSTRSYYAPNQIYRELDMAMQRIGVRPGTVMFHGFSRGSANAYAVAALDAGRGKRYFALSVASSGGVAVDYPPTRAILEGAFGNRPLAGTRWITAAGARDQEPERDGIPAMRRSANWLREQGATVVASIEDANEGHGALQTNPANARQVLDLFLSAPN
jgi:hypothetical protein